MTQAANYQRIHRDHLTAVREGDIVADENLKDGSVDGRRGVGLVIPVNLGSVYASLIEAFRSVEPGQYLYPVEDLHMTFPSKICT